MDGQPLSLRKTLTMRHALVSAFVCAVFSVALVAQTRAPDAAGILEKARAAEARFDTKTALDLYLGADAERPNDVAILLKISRQYSDATLDTPDVAEKKRLCTEALNYAQRAAQLEPRNAVGLLSLAICYGKLGTYSDTRTKIEYSRRVKEYADQAVAIDPGYDYAHHVLGRWNYEVATLGFGARVIVRVIYGGLPTASTAEAVRQLQRAVELSPQLPAHRVELGFALLADGQRDAARQTFHAALAMPMVEKYDTEAFRRAREALADL
jgi:tetratricopeptide (TPR) repeat protein